MISGANEEDLIIAIGYDYDGFSKAENLKGLIDELVRFAVADMML